jgi:hypothetical protein
MKKEYSTREKNFVKVYMWKFHTNASKAHKVYRESSDNFINNLIIGSVFDGTFEKMKEG